MTTYAVASRKAGFSLVELLVSLALGLVLTIGVIQVFVASKAGYQVQDSASRLQENARFAAGHLRKHLRLSDLWAGHPGEALGAMAPLVPNEGSPPCSPTWMLDFMQPVRGYDGRPASPLPGCVAAEYVAHSDLVAVRYADPSAYVPSRNLNGDTAAELTRNGRYFVRGLVGRYGVLFDYAQRAAAQEADNDRDGIQEAGEGVAGDEAGGVVTYRFKALTFFLRNDRSTGRGVPSLYWRRLDRDGVSPAQAIVPGVEQLQFEYGVDTDADLAANRFMPADSVTEAGDWRRVVAVRAAFVVRGDALDDYTDTAAYSMPGGFVFRPEEIDAAYQRRLFVEEIQLRNRTR